MTEPDCPPAVDTMASFVERPAMRPRIATRFGPRLHYVGADGRQVALALTESQLWELGLEVANALAGLRAHRPSGN